MQLPPTLTLSTAAVTLQTLRSAAEGAEAQDTQAWQVDASALHGFDTAALAVLLQVKRLAQARGRAFAVHGAPPKLVQLAQLYGVSELLGLAPAS